MLMRSRRYRSKNKNKHQIKFRIYAARVWWKRIPLRVRAHQQRCKARRLASTCRQRAAHACQTGSSHRRTKRSPYYHTTTTATRHTHTHTQTRKPQTTHANILKHTCGQTHSAISTLSRAARLCLRTCARLPVRREKSLRGSRTGDQSEQTFCACRSRTQPNRAHPFTSSRRRTRRFVAIAINISTACVVQLKIVVRRLCGHLLQRTLNVWSGVYLCEFLVCVCV